MNKVKEFMVTLLPICNNEKIGRVLCSFLNTKGGKIFIGVDFAGKVNGIQLALDKVSKLRSFLIGEIVPDALFDVSVESVLDKTIIIVSAEEGSRQPYVFDGSIYYRNGMITHKASSKEISALIRNRQDDELHWERQIKLGVEWEDLDEALIVKTFNEARMNNRTSYSGEHVVTFLEEYGLMSNMSFTNACTLLFAKKAHQFFPQSRVRLTEYPANKISDNLLRDEFLEGNLFSIVDRLQDYIDNLGTRSVFIENDLQRKDFRYPPFALREGFINALIHRDYSSYHSHMTISVFPERLVISNSGSLPEELGGAKALKSEHRSYPNNPDIAHIFFLRAYIDKLGRGTNKIIDECDKAGLKHPTWKSTKSEVVLTINGPKISKSPAYDALALSFDALNKAQNDTLNDALNDALNKSVSSKVLNRLQQTIQMLYISKSLTLANLMDSLSVSRATMQRDMLFLNNLNLIDLKGSDKYREYLLNDALRAKIDALK